jgi:hypothetical protein
MVFALRPPLRSEATTPSGSGLVMDESLRPRNGCAQVAAKTPAYRPDGVRGPRPALPTAMRHDGACPNLGRPVALNEAGVMECSGGGDPRGAPSWAMALEGSYVRLATDGGPFCVSDRSACG